MTEGGFYCGQKKRRGAEGLATCRLMERWYVRVPLADSPGAVDGFWSVVRRREGVVVDFKKSTDQIISFQLKLRGRDSAPSQRVQKRAQETEASRRTPHPLLRESDVPSGCLASADMKPKPQDHFHQGEGEIHQDTAEREFTNNYANHLNLEESKRA